MSKTGKIVGVVALVVVLLVAGLIVLVKALVTPERVRQVVLPRAEAALERPVDLGEIRISFFSGIMLEDLRVGERAQKEGEPFIAADRAVLRYQFWPLLRGEVIVDEVRLVGPKIRVIRNPDGTFNFSDLLPAGEEPTGEPAVAEKEEGKNSLDLVISKVALENGEVTFLDRQVNAEAPLRFVADQLNFEGSDLAADRPFPVLLSGRLGGAPFRVEGQVSPAAPGATLQVGLERLDVTAFTPYFAQGLPGELGSLKASLDLSLEAGEKELASSGKVTLEDLALRLQALPEAPLRDGELTLDYALKADLEQALLNLEKAAIDFNGIPLQVSGKIENFLEKPLLDLHALLPGVELRTALAGLPPGLVAPLSELDPAGEVRADLTLAGPADAGARLLRKGRVELRGVAGNLAGGRPALTGAVNLDGDRASSEDLVLRLGDDTARIDLQAENLFGKPVGLVLNLAADRFDLVPLLAGGGDDGKEPSRPTPPGAPEEAGPLDLPVRAEGNLAVARAGYRGLDLEDVRGKFRLVQNRFTLEEFSARLAGGSLGGTGWADLARKGFAYGGKFQVDGVRADPIVTAFAPKAAGTVFGALNLATDLRGAGTTTEGIKRSLDGEGDLRLVDGKLTGAGLTQGLAEFLGLESLRNLEFRDFKGHFTLKQGKLSIKSDFAAPDLRMAPRGTVGLDGSLDLSLNAALSPELSARLPRADRFAGVLGDDQGWTELPLQVTGSLGAPRFGLDTSAAAERARTKVKEKLQEKVLEKLAPRSAGEEGEKSETTTPKKQLEDAVRGLFGN